ncbi:hypothetical protein H5410_061273 [Solanum commersonii]|uniref:Ubiquitin-like protease family profile domain-containing protein n=1 Tax=Solanum commersonii TaxID=4109 RepID=A0A9J5W791_SOLCO|nr:hypothetical protein H5410_061273 [Solanum commersonii]
MFGKYIFEPMRSHLRIHVTLSWFTVDNILIPINVKERLHCVLIVVCFNKCCIMVYDSLRNAIHNSYVLIEIKNICTTYTDKGLDVLSHPKYRFRIDFDSFDIVYVNDIPQQPQGSMDYGVYISAYAEFLGDGNGILAGPFDPYFMLSRYVTLL